MPKRTEPRKPPPRRGRGLDFTTSPSPRTPTENIAAAPRATGDDEKGAEPIKPVYLPRTIYVLFKQHCALRGVKMLDLLYEIISDYLSRNGIAVPPKKARKNARD